MQRGTLIAIVAIMAFMAVLFSAYNQAKTDQRVGELQRCEVELSLAEARGELRDASLEQIIRWCPSYEEE